MLGLGFALTNFGTKGGVVDTPDLSGSSAAALLAAYGGEGFSMIFDSTAPSIKITDSTTPSNDWDSDLGDGYSVQDFFKSRSFTSYSGPVSSGKRLMQSDGYIKPCRHNLIPMSNRFGSAAWTLTAATSTYGQTDVDGGATASLITESNTSTSVLYNATAFTTAANVPYTISCKIKKGNSTWVRLAFGTSGGTFTNGVQQWYNLDTVATGTAATTGTASYISSSITATTNSYYILTLTASQASTTGAFIVSTATADASATRTTSGTYYICQAMCNSGSSALDYVSSEAHNLILQSADVTTSWTNVGSTDSGNTDTGPDGTTTADRVIETAAGGRHCVYQAFSTAVVGLPVTYTARVKQGTRQYAFLQLSDNSLATYGVTFDLSNGAVGDVYTASSPTGTGYAVTALANGFYELSVTKTSGHATTYAVLALSDSLTPSAYTSDTPSYVGDGSSYIIVGNQQIELSSAPGRYVATTAAAVYNQHFDLPVEYNTNGTVKALTREEARTNLALYSNNLTNAAWTKSNMSTAMTATGADGASSSATTCTATAANATVLQAITSASSARITSAYIKRRTGSGNIDMTQDNGSTWTTVSVTSSWTRLNIASVTSTNPTVGLRIVTSGDEIDVMYFQHEAAATISSPIVTGSAAVTRAADVISMSSKIFPDHVTNGTIYMSVKERNANASYGHYFGLGFDANNRVQIDDNADGAFIRAYTRKASTNSSVLTPAVNSPGTANKISFGYDGSAVIAGYNGSSTSGSDGATSFSALSTLYIGASYDGTLPITAEIYEFMYVPTALTAGEHQTLTTL